jgi:uncharacterized protein (TIGR01777 family)
MNVLITGGTGLIGSALTQSLLADGHKVWILSRSQGRVPGAQSIPWDGRTSFGWLDLFSEMDAVVNLAGATIGSWPWTAAKKQAILDSRVWAGRAILEACEKAARSPDVIIQASGIGYYGPRATELLDEDSPAGNDFLSNVAVAWESSTRLIDTMGVRRCIIRTALVLDHRRGVLPLMALPVKLFAGGPLGSGKQGISWIHIDDQVRAIRFLIENDKARGVFNLTSPNPVSNADFMRKLAASLNRPCWLPAPAFAMRLLLGEMSTLLLDGQYAIPQRLVNLGFSFNFETLGDALTDLHD